MSVPCGSTGGCPALWRCEQAGKCLHPPEIARSSDEVTKVPKSRRRPKAPSVRDCGCVDKVNKLLEARNTGIDVGLTMNFTTGSQGDCLRIVTYKLDQKKKGRAANLLARHCPFCGARYE